ncbi:MAG: hypothetical protein JSS24_08775 [Proteobacteria bacterium]|nr:hypothetical protein [Pseudomonadota bacterium]
MTTFIVLAALMALAAAAIIAWPLYRARRKPWLPVAASVLLLALSGFLYSRWSNWDWSGKQQMPSQADQILDMVARLERRLAAKPDDLQGWLLLGRSYMTLERFDDAIVAYDQALKLGGGKDAEGALGMGEAIAMRAGGQIIPPAAEMFETAVKLAPQNPRALLFGGFAAANRGDKALAKSRWEALKALNPPPQLAKMIDARIAALDTAPAATTENATPSSAAASARVTVRLAPALNARVKPDSVLFLFANLPAERGPPLAVKRLSPADIGKPLELSAADSMVPGRSLRQGQTVQLTARISFSGQPLPSAGDLYGELTYNVGHDGTRELLIDRVAQ